MIYDMIHMAQGMQLITFELYFRVTVAKVKL